MVISQNKNTYDLSDKVNKKGIFKVCNCQVFHSSILPPKNSDFLTIVGSSERVREDVKKWGIHGDIMTVNYTGLFLNRNYTHLVSFHADLFKYIVGFRKLAMSSKPFISHTSGHINKRIEDNKEFINYIWQFKPEPRSSGLLALWVGIALGYDKIMLLGLPLDDSGRFTDIEDDKTRNIYYKETISICQSKVDFSKYDFVRSASGETKRIFGEPTWPWIQE